MRAATASPAAEGAPARGGGLAGVMASGPSLIGLSFSSVTMRWASLGPTPWARPTAALSSRATAWASSAGASTSSTASAALGPTPWMASSRDEGVALLAGQEAVEPHAGGLGPLGLDVQQRLLARRRQALERARSAADHIADAADVDQRVLLAGLGHGPAQAADHADGPEVAGAASVGVGDGHRQGVGGVGGRARRRWAAGGRS